MSKYRKQYLCPQCQTNLASKKSVVCRDCHNKNVRDKALARAAQKEDAKQQRKEDRKQREIAKVKRVDRRTKLPKCPSELPPYNKPPIMELKFVKDGVTQDGMAIQTKTFLIKGYEWLDKFVGAAKLHPAVKKPVKKVILVSKIGFDGGATKRQFEIKTSEGIEVIFAKPDEMLKLDDNRAESA